MFTTEHTLLKDKGAVHDLTQSFLAQRDVTYNQNGSYDLFTN
jgi:hypothetical protein